eukprot:15466918-Alexandrium_andersonii.AAC.1
MQTIRPRVTSRIQGSPKLSSVVSRGPRGAPLGSLRAAPSANRQMSNKHCACLQRFAAVCCAASPGGATTPPPGPPQKAPPMR